MDLRGRTALVTGGARRVGRAIALALAEAGMRLIVHYHSSRQDAHELCSRIRELGGEATAVAANLADEKEVERLVRRSEEFGHVDVLINNASVYFKTPIERSTADWDLVMNVNLRAPYLCSTLLGLRMKERGEGKVINLADWSAHRPYPDLIPYCVSKAGLVAMSKGLARALGPQVQVNSISPGAVLLTEDYPEAAAQKARAHTVLGRLGDPQDVADAVLYLLKADFVTGVDLIVDGGRTIYGI